MHTFILSTLILGLACKEEENIKNSSATDPTSDWDTNTGDTEDTNDTEDTSDTEDTNDTADTAVEDNFCADYVAVCTEFPESDVGSDCETWWGAAAAGADGDSSGATQACYDYHLGVASTQTEQDMIDAHCAHAAGLADASGAAPCVDPEPTFCELYTATCGDFPTDFGSDCETWYSAAAPGTENDATGASQACYDYHLGVAGTMTEADAIAAHCAHSLGLADANGSQYCVADPDIDGDGSAASVDCNDADATVYPGAVEVLGDGIDNNCNAVDDDFCTSYESTCGTPITDCETWWNNSAAGTPGESSGASQACYAYHYDVATQQSDQAMIDAHCAHAAGQADGSGTAPCQ